MSDFKGYKGSIFVRPDNLFYILYYAFCTNWTWPDLSEFEDVVPDEEFENLLDMFSGVLEKHLAKQLKQGLYREYINRTEDLPTIRGKIDITGTIRNKIAHRQLISCEYDELSENTLSNRIIKTAVNFLLRKGKMKPEREESLRQEIRYFSNVDEIHDLTSIPWSRLHFHRNNKDYRILIFVSRLILKELLLIAEDGEYELESFIDERRMNMLYEKFILGYYQEELSSRIDTVAASQIKWALDEKDTYEKLPKMQSDITLSRDDKTLIIDAKWYKKILQPKKTVRKSQDSEEDAGDDQVDADENYGDNQGRIRSANLYQIFTYVKNKEANLGKESHTVSGMLLYAQTHKKGEIVKIKEDSIRGQTGQPFNPNKYHIGEYTICGNKIHVRALDLTEDFEGVKKQLDSIADEFLFSEAKQQG